MAYSLLNRDLFIAFAYNPFLFLLGVVFVLWTLYGLWIWYTGNKITVSLQNKEALYLKLTLLSLFAVNWIYLVAVGM